MQFQTKEITTLTQRELALETELLELQQHGTVPGLNSPIQKLITLFWDPF